MSAHQRYHPRWTICLGRTENTKGSRALRRRRHSHAIVVVVVVSCCDCRPRSDHLCLDQIDVRLRLLHSMVVVLACVIVVVVVVVRRMPNTAPPDLNCTARYKFPLMINHCIPRCPKSVRCDARCCLYRSSYLYHRHHQREKAPFPSSPQCRMLLLLRLAEYGFLLTGYVQKKLPT